MSKNIVKLLIDVVLGVVFALLFNHHVLGGLTFHETAGLAIGGGVVVHVLLNAKWVRRVTCALFSPKTNAKTRVGYILNILLLIDLVVIIVSGLFISKVLLPDVASASPLSNMQQIHIAMSYIGLALIGVHLGLHRKWLMATLRNLFHVSSKSKVRAVFAHGAMVAVLVFGAYSMATTGYFEKATTFAQDENAASAHGHGSQGSGSTDQASERQSGAAAESGSNSEARAAYASSINPVQIAATYLSIMGAFAVATGYLEMVIVKAKSGRRRQAAQANPAKAPTANATE